MWLYQNNIFSHCYVENYYTLIYDKVFSSNQASVRFSKDFEDLLANRSAHWWWHCVPNLSKDKKSHSGSKQCCRKKKFLDVKRSQITLSAFVRPPPV